MLMLKLTDVSHRLNVPYFRLYSLVISGNIPAHRSENGRYWLVKEDDLPEIERIIKGESVSDIVQVA